jgi:hypothetical protein
MADKKPMTEAEWWAADAERHNETCRQLQERRGETDRKPVEPPKLNPDGSLRKKSLVIKAVSPPKNDLS